MRWFLIIALSFSATIASAQLSADKYIALARNDIKSQNYSLAIQRLNFALKTQPYNVEAYFLRGMAKYNLEDYNGAIIDYSHCLRIAPQNSAVYQNRGLAKAKAKDHTGAIQDFEKAIKYDPGNYFAYINLAYSQLQTQQFKEAEATCTRAIGMNEYMETGFLLRGMALNELEEYDKAIVDYSKVIEINPASSEAYLRRAMAHNDKLEFTKAIADCDQAIALDSVSSMGYFVKANIYADRLNYDSALVNYDKVIEINPYNAMAYFNRANVEVRLDKYKKAAYDYRKVTEINPDNVIGHFNLALTYHKLDRLDLALESYNKTIELFPDMEDAWFNRAMIKKEMGDVAGAQMDYYHGNEIRAKRRKNPYDYEQEERLKEVTHMDADFYRPNFTEEEQQIAIYSFPFFELKSLDYKSINNSHLYYNIKSLTLYNESHNNNPFIYLTTSLLSSNDSTQFQQSVKNTGLDQGSRHQLLDQAIRYKMDFDFNRSLATYDTLIELYPGFALAYFNKASTLLDLLELMLKLEAGTGKFIDLGESANTVQLKDMQTLNVKLKEIEQLYLTCLDLDPNFHFAWFNVGIVRSEMGKFETSLDAYDKAIKVNPDFPEAYYNRGLTYLYLKNNKKACHELSKAGELGIKDAYVVIQKYCKTR